MSPLGHGPGRNQGGRHDLLRPGIPGERQNFDAEGRGADFGSQRLPHGDQPPFPSFAPEPLRICWPSRPAIIRFGPGLQRRLQRIRRGGVSSGAGRLPGYLYPAGRRRGGDLSGAAGFAAAAPVPRDGGPRQCVPASETVRPAGGYPEAGALPPAGLPGVRGGGEARRALPSRRRYGLNLSGGFGIICSTFRRYKLRSRGRGGRF